MDTKHIAELLARHREELEGYQETCRALEKEIKRLEGILRNEMG